MNGVPKKEQSGPNRKEERGAPAGGEGNLNSQSFSNPGKSERGKKGTEKRETQQQHPDYGKEKILGATHQNGRTAQEENNWLLRKKKKPRKEGPIPYWKRTEGRVRG